MSAIKIADKFGCTDAAVLKALKRNNIVVRTHKDAAINKEMTPEHRAKITEVARNMNKGKFGELHPGWKNARHIDKNGYVLVRRNGKTVREHRWVMEQHLGRKLEPWEEVNHIGIGQPGNKQNNVLSNLEVIPNEHKRRDWLALNEYRRRQAQQES